MDRMRGPDGVAETFYERGGSGASGHARASPGGGIKVPDGSGGGGRLGWSNRRVVVVDASMRPTLEPGDRLVVDPTAYRERDPRVGEIVVLVDPEEPSRWLVKRIAAVGPSASPRPSDGIAALPPGSVFVLSDAVGPTRDSRSFGPVPRSSLRGRARRIYFPRERRAEL